MNEVRICQVDANEWMVGTDPELVVMLMVDGEVSYATSVNTLQEVTALVNRELVMGRLTKIPRTIARTT
jgi:hypothetical protein